MTDDNSSSSIVEKLLVERNAVKFGDFTLSSGMRTTFFVNVKNAATDPKALKIFAEEIAKNVRAQVIAGVELGAVPLLAATSLNLGDIPYIIVRKEYKHGTKDLLVGNLSEGAKVDIVEDVVSTGGSALYAAKLLRERGAKVSRVITVVDREEGGRQLLKENKLELIPLLRLSDMKMKVR